MSMAPSDDHINRAEVRSLLERRRRRLVADVRWRTARLRDDRTGDPIEADAGIADEQDLDASLIEIATATLQHIDRAIERLNNGHYGWCTRCHRRIGMLRLRAMPFALRCRDCEAAREAERRTAPVERQRRQPDDCLEGP